MTTFDDREKSMEKKFALEEELEFRINARKHKLVGLWAASRLGKSGAEAEAYAKEVVMADFESDNHGAIVAKLLRDAADAGNSLTEKEVRIALDQCDREARRQIMQEQHTS
jgi:hypothetical protein